VSKVVTIVDYGLGNLGSVANMLRKVGVQPRMAIKPEDVLEATALILPGVGHFDTGMKNLRERALEPALNDQVVKKQVPILGICLGVQLFARKSEEGVEPGLGWIAADVKRFQFEATSPLPIPHMGWNEVETRDEVLFNGASDQDARYYFVHSYHLVADEPGDVAAWSTYGYRFAAAVRRGNIAGSQFHPEKSHRYGMNLLRNWLAAVGHAP
jgi:glutamine amidotransferase